MDTHAERGAFQNRLITLGKRRENIAKRQGVEIKAIVKKRKSAEPSPSVNPSKNQISLENVLSPKEKTLKDESLTSGNFNFLYNNYRQAIQTHRDVFMQAQDVFLYFPGLLHFEGRLVSLKKNITVF